MFLFLILAIPLLAASAYFLLNIAAKTVADTPRREQSSARLKLTRNGFTNTLDEFNYQQNSKKIQAEKIKFAARDELKRKADELKSETQKKEEKEKLERGRLAMAQLSKLVIANHDKKEELALVYEPQKPANDALDFFTELEKPSQNDEPEVESEIANTLVESILGDVLSSSIGLPLPLFESASTLNDAVKDDPKPTNSMPAKRKRM